jgi:hypothetical protein
MSIWRMDVGEKIWKIFSKFERAGFQESTANEPTCMSTDVG